jgi:hypothetical protein
MARLVRRTGAETRVAGETSSLPVLGRAGGEVRPGRAARAVSHAVRMVPVGAGLPAAAILASAARIPASGQCLPRPNKPAPVARAFSYAVRIVLVGAGLPAAAILASAARIPASGQCRPRPKKPAPVARAFSCHSWRRGHPRRGVAPLPRHDRSARPAIPNMACQAEERCSPASMKSMRCGQLSK